MEVGQIEVLTWQKVGGGLPWAQLGQPAAVQLPCDGGQALRCDEPPGAAVSHARSDETPQLQGHVFSTKLVPLPICTIYFI